MEIWKDIYFIENGVEHDYRGLYQVSNHGRVKSLERVDSIGRIVKEKILKARKFKNDYKCILLSKNGEKKNFYIHRLVAFLFIVNDNPIEKIEVDHIIPVSCGGTNHVDNLKWCTKKENRNNLLTRKHNSEANKDKSRNKGSLVTRYDLNMNLIDLKYQYEFVQMGFDAGSISRCCKGRLKTHKGFIFKYYQEID